MYAVFQLSGFQYSAEEGSVLKVPRQTGETGSTFDIKEVLLIRDDQRTLAGTPVVKDARIEAEILKSGKSEKVLTYKYKRRTKYRRTQGHRQDYSEIRINKIVAPES